MTEPSNTLDWSSDGGTNVSAPPEAPGYEILAELGRGGMGVVYKARQYPLNRLVAIKFLRDAVLAGPQERARFRTEAAAAARLNHPHLVSVFEVGEHRGLQFFTMELLEGGGLDRRLRSHPLSIRESAELIRTLALAIQHAHDASIIHRDLKPANILFGPAGPKIADFGLAKRLDSDSTGWTRDGAVLGTAGYMAPEQAAGHAAEVGPTADVYSLGAILYELIARRPPFQGDGWAKIIDQVLYDEPTPPSRYNADSPSDLDVICLKCLEKAPDRRFTRAAELAEELTRFLDGRPLAARPIGDEEKLARSAEADGFELAGEIGRGPHAVVYRATSRPFSQVVAVKVFAEVDEFARVRWREWFDWSSTLWAAVTHPQVLLPVRRGWWRDRPYLVMDFVPQGSLASQLAGGPQPLEQSLRLVVQLAEIVCYLHRQGFVHGNLKPSNVLLAADGIPRLADLRLPSDLVADARDGFTAPELADDPMREPHPPADVYGLAVILYSSLTGAAPTADAEPPSKQAAEIRPEIDHLLSRCLQRNPWHRYARAYDMLAQLRQLLKEAEAAAAKRTKKPRAR
jgi:eukaryotic-like serine/threonine-protein kinase